MTSTQNSRKQEIRVSAYSHRTTTITCLTIAAAAIALRLPGLWTNFWLDEIWALQLAEHTETFAGVFTRLSMDTNHWLYTLIMKMYNPGSHWWVYRIPSFAAGIAALPLVFALASKWSRSAGITALILCSFSCFLIVYASEARGYSLAIFFSLLSVWLLEKYHENCSPLIIPAFWLVGTLGIFSNLSFIMIYPGLLLFSLISLWKREKTVPGAAAKTMLIHLIPVMAIGVVVLVLVPKMTHGGGAEQTFLESALTFSSFALGAPDRPGWNHASIGITGFIIISGIWLVSRKSLRHALLFSGSIVLGPCLMAIQAPKDFSFWYARHFLICLPFIYIIAAITLTIPARLQTINGKAMLAVILMLYGIGQFHYLSDFFQHGRGKHLMALKWMADRTEQETITLTSDHHFRNLMLLSFYAPYVPDKKFDYYRDPYKPPQWFIMHSENNAESPDSISIRGTSYELEKRFQSSHMSGFDWFLYARHQ